MVTAPAGSPADSGGPAAPDPPPPGPPTPTPPVRRRRWPTVAVVLALLLGALGVVGWRVHLPYDTLAPGSARQVNDLVAVKGHPVYPPRGKVLFETVAVRERINAFELLAAWVDPNVDVISDHELRGPLPPDQYRQESIQAMADSKTTAEVVALRRLGYTDIEGGPEIQQVEPGRPATALLRPHDVILAVEGKAVTDVQSTVAAVRSHQAGEVVHLRIRRDGAELEVAPALARGDQGQPLLGVQLAPSLKLPFDITIDSGSVEGPSAGLAYALELLDYLTPGELTGGRVVAATGELSADGKIAPIGGVAQKVVTVRRAGATLLLVPRQNYAEAKKHAGSHLQVRPVDTFDDALQALGSLSGSNALALPGPESGSHT